MRAFEFLTEGRKPGHFWSPGPDHTQDIADLYASGFTTADMAKEYKIDRGTMELFLHRLPNFDQLRQLRNVARQEQGLTIGIKGITPEQKQEMVDKFIVGKNYNQLAKEFGLTGSYVNKMLSSMPNFEELLQQNTKARQEQGLLTTSDLGSKGITYDDVIQMGEMYAQGSYYSTIGKRFGIDQAMVARHLQKLPNYAAIRLSNTQNRAKKLGGTQSLTNRGINKPGSKGIRAIRRTGSPSGGAF